MKQNLMDLMKSIDVSKSAFVGLKTELLKKQEEVKRIKDQQLNKNVELVLKPKKNVVIKKSNKGVEERNLNDLNDVFEDDCDVLKKSREVLEAKTRLYDKLNNGNPSATNTKTSQYLIDFDVKHELSRQKSECDSEPNQPPDEADVYDLSNSSDHDSDWVEFEDSLGRTRKCLRKDLKEMKAKDSKLASSLRPPTPPQPSQQLLSRDMQRELMRQKWEEQETALIGKNNVHYQDVLFDEVRAHGVSYFEFSTNEEERLRQQEALKHLRNETIEKQQAVETLHARRQHQLKVRLAAARKRRQERLGLPVEEVEYKVPEITTSQHEEPPKDDLKIIDMEENIQKIASVRPWDIGKQEAGSVLSQEEWVDKKREERLEEFAPPQSLLKNVDTNSRIAKATDKRKYKDANDKEMIGDSAKVLANNKIISLSVQNKNEESNLNSLLKNNSGSYLNQIHETTNIKYSSSFLPEYVRLTSTDKIEFSDTIKLKQHPNSDKFSPKIDKTYKDIKSSKQNQTVNKQNKSINNYLSFDAPASSEQSTEHFKNTKRKWAETAPPATMEYFAGNLNRRKERKTQKVNLAESVSAGLHYIKELTEKKNRTRVKGLLDIV